MVERVTLIFGIVLRLGMVVYEMKQNVLLKAKIVRFLNK